MKQYLDICQEILDTKTKLTDNRTGVRTLRNPAGAVFIHDMDMGFPLITTKKMGLKNIATEFQGDANCFLPFNKFSPSSK